MKNEKVNSWVTLMANLGVIGGLVFVGYGIAQNTTQIRAEASYSVNEALGLHNSAIYSDAVLADILLRGEESLSSLNPTELRQFSAFQYDRINLAIHVIALETDGLSEIHFPYVERLVQDFRRSPGLQEFLVLVEDEWVGTPELYERLRLRD